MKNYKVVYTKECRIIPEYVKIFGIKKGEKTENGWKLNDEMVRHYFAQNNLCVKKMEVWNEECSTHEIQVRYTKILVQKREEICH